MSMAPGPYFDLTTVALLREALDDAWACLSAKKQGEATKSLLAERILKVAATGERDRERLVAAALSERNAA